MYDPHTRESRGFGFVTMETGEEADAAITALHGTDLMGKAINVEKVCTDAECEKYLDNVCYRLVEDGLGHLLQGGTTVPRSVTIVRIDSPDKDCSSDSRFAVERPYDPRPYDSRYTRDYDDRRRGGGRYDDYRGGGGGGGGGCGGGRDYDRGGHRDYDRDRRDYDRGGRGGYEDRRY